MPVSADLPWLKYNFTAIVPIIKVSLDGRPSLIGTGFFITSRGLLVTAKHVITDNINDIGNDAGGIGALLLDHQNFGQYLPLAWTSWHSVADIAISDTRPRLRADETQIETAHLRLSVDEPPVGSMLTSRFFCHADLAVSDKDLDLPRGERTIRTFTLEHSFHAAGPETPETSIGLIASQYGSQDRQGTLRCHYRPIRDTVMLPFPVFESDLAIPGSGSGGPVFNAAGLVVGINTTGIPGSDIAYHTYISSALKLGVRMWVNGGVEPAVITLAEASRIGALEIEGLV